MVHCTGGAQTKVLHFVNENCRVIKDNMFPVPPLFHAIKECSGTDWKEMYQVFNMGHRMEIYVRPEVAEQVIAISKEFNIDAQIQQIQQNGVYCQKINHASSRDTKTIF